MDMFGRFSKYPMLYEIKNILMFMRQPAGEERQGRQRDQRLRGPRRHPLPAHPSGPRRGEAFPPPPGRSQHQQQQQCQRIEQAESRPATAVRPVDAMEKREVGHAHSLKEKAKSGRLGGFFSRLASFRFSLKKGAEEKAKTKKKSGRSVEYNSILTSYTQSCTEERYK
ncbi:hypothetical protein NQ317_015093 [Molorchus minor]|uniref:Uncharacterized protein n=1 Tax=Molorchus minor TaxID=1323400 RepID=A0ABQ9K6F3_9CUCU|nr:hypothetical protein NQ317_015093 [Molorchus minor]